LIVFLTPCKHAVEAIVIHIFFQSNGVTEAASFYCSGIATTSAMNDLLLHQSTPLPLWLIVFTSCKHTAEAVIAHVFFAEQQNDRSSIALLQWHCHNKCHKQVAAAWIDAVVALVDCFSYPLQACCGSHCHTHLF